MPRIPAAKGPRLGRVLSALFLLGLQLGGSARPADAADFLVIVNEQNPISTLSPQEISRLFLKKSTRWPDGVGVRAVDLSPASAIRESFSRAIHQKSTSAVKVYWQKMIFSGREVPPPEKGSAAEVVAFVKANRGAIGYVPAGTSLWNGVKVLAVSQ